MEEQETIEAAADRGTLPKYVTVTGDLEFEVNILDDDTLTVSIAGDAQAEEGNAIVVTLTTDAQAAYEFPVHILFSASSAIGVRPATLNADYTATTEVTFPAFRTETTFRIATVEDRLDEGDEMFNVGLIDPTGANAVILVDDTITATMTIVDDDHAPVVTTTKMRVLTERTEVQGRLRGSDADGDRLTWRIANPGGADAGLFTLTEDGQLSLDMARTLDAPGDADNDGTYELIVVANDGDNDSAAAAIEIALVDAAPPSPPTNLAVTADNENEVLFRWDPPADDGGAPVTHYAYRYDANEDGVFVRWGLCRLDAQGTAPAQELGHRRRCRRGRGVRAGDGGERGQLPDRAGAARSRGQPVAGEMRAALRPGRGSAGGAGVALGDVDASRPRGPRMGRAGRERQLAAVGLPHRGLDRRRRELARG